MGKFASIKSAGSKLMGKVRGRSLNTYKTNSSKVSAGAPDIFSMDMDAYKRNFSMNQRKNTMKSLVKAKNSSGSFKPGKVQTTIKAKASQAAKSIATAGRNARKSVKNFGKTISGMGSRDSYVNSRDGTGLIPGGKTLGAVNNTGSMYKTSDLAKAAAAGGRNRNLRKTRGGGERRNPNLGRVLADGEKPRRRPSKSSAAGQVDSV